MIPSIKASKKVGPSKNSAPLKKIAWGMMLLLALLLFVVAGRYLTFNPEVYFPEQRMVYLAHTFGITAHIVGGDARYRHRTLPVFTRA